MNLDILHAIKQNDLKTLSYLIEQNTSNKSYQFNGFSIIIYACLYNSNDDILHYLLDNNKVTLYKEHDTLLFDILKFKHNDIIIVKKTLDKINTYNLDSLLNKTNTYNKSPLYIAIEQNYDINIIELLIKHGSIVNDDIIHLIYDNISFISSISDNFNKYKNKIHQILHIIKHSKISLLNNTYDAYINFHTLLSKICYNYKLYKQTFLKKTKYFSFHLNQQELQTIDTDFISIIKLLLEKGANPNIYEYVFYNPLYSICEINNLELVEFMLNYNIIINDFLFNAIIKIKDIDQKILYYISLINSNTKSASKIYNF